MKNLALGLLLATLAALPACSGSSSGGGGGGGTTFNADMYVGTWTGTWNNTKFSSTGPVSITVARNGSSLTFTVDLGGSVFGGSDPAAENFTLNFTQTGGSLVAKTSTVYGDVTASVTAANVVTIAGANIPGAVKTFSLTGTWGATTATANVSITFDAGGTPAAATATLTKT